VLVDAAGWKGVEKEAEVYRGAYKFGGGVEVEVLVREARTGCAK
jgi:hypothetical protein